MLRLKYLWHLFRSGRSLRPMPGRFLVAFSFASEDRQFVERLARATEAILGYATVFYDEWFEHHLAGESGRKALEEIYRDRCVLAIPCLSSHYHDKYWPQTEREAMRSRSVGRLEWLAHRADMSVMSIQVGDDPIKSRNAIIPDVRHRALVHTVSIIRTRVLSLEKATEPQTIEFQIPRSPSSQRFVALGITTLILAVLTASTGGLLFAQYF